MFALHLRRQAVKTNERDYLITTIVRQIITLFISGVIISHYLPFFSGRYSCLVV